MHGPVVPTLPKNGEGWGTLACGASVEFKGTRVSDTHTHVGFLSGGMLFVLCKGAGDSWFSEVVPGFAVYFVARHAPLAGREDFHPGDGAE